MAVEGRGEIRQDGVPLGGGMGMAFGVAAKGIRRSLLGLAALLGLLLASLARLRPSPAANYKVGMREVDWSHGARPMVMTLFDPAEITDPAAKHRDAIFRRSDLYRERRGVGGQALSPRHAVPWQRQQWAGLCLVRRISGARGYIVAALNHYRANTYESSIVYLTNKIWQRPLDIALDITWLKRIPLGPAYRRRAHRRRGHSQGGFTSLWIGGAEVNPELFTPISATGERTCRSHNICARDAGGCGAGAASAGYQGEGRFRHGPGIVQAFGMDPAELAKMAVPAYLIVGAADTQTPPAENAAFAAKYIPKAELNIIPGRVDHEIFTNECDQEGRDNFPESCIDAPGVDRAALHEMIGAAAVNFFDRNLDVQRPE